MFLLASEDMGTLEYMIMLGVLLCVFGYFLYLIYYALDLFFLNPFLKIPSLTEKEEEVINFHLPFYRGLSNKMQNKFKRRVVRFRHRKTIVFHEDVEGREEIILLLSATAVMLTLGMYDFLILSVKKIIIYPKEYHSAFTRLNHYGEYNRGQKTLIFAANHLRKGFRIPNDNINLAVHEFAHALSFNLESKFGLRTWFFRNGMRRLKSFFESDAFWSRMDETGYFREYGKTNMHEFFAVIIENFVETPASFREKFPELYKTLKKMLNMDYYHMPKIEP